VTGAVYQRGKTRTHGLRGTERESAIGKYQTISKRGYSTEKQAWEAMREADRDRVVRISARTIAQFFIEWFAAVEPFLDATTWRNWKH
jgi:Arm DNA-binding domain